MPQWQLEPEPGSVFLLAGLARALSPAAPVHLPALVSMESFFHLARVQTGVCISLETEVGVEPNFILLRATILVELNCFSVALTCKLAQLLQLDGQYEP